MYFLKNSEKIYCIDVKYLFGFTLTVISHSLCQWFTFAWLFLVHQFIIVGDVSDFARSVGSQAVPFFVCILPFVLNDRSVAADVNGVDRIFSAIVPNSVCAKNDFHQFIGLTFATPAQMNSLFQISSLLL